MTEDRVRVMLRRTGGFAGVTLESTLDSADLETAAAESLRADVASFTTALLAGTSPDAGAAGDPDAGRPGGPAGWPPGRDLMRYRLTIDRSGHLQTVELAEPDVPAAARPLLQRLVAATRR